MLRRDKVEAEYAELYPRIGLTVFSPLAGGILTGAERTDCVVVLSLSWQAFSFLCLS